MNIKDNMLTQLADVMQKEVGEISLLELDCYAAGFFKVTTLSDCMNFAIEKVKKKNPSFAGYFDCLGTNDCMKQETQSEDPNIQAFYHGLKRGREIMISKESIEKRKEDMINFSCDYIKTRDQLWTVERAVASYTVSGMIASGSNCKSYGRR